VAEVIVENPPKKINQNRRTINNGIIMEDKNEYGEGTSEDEYSSNVDSVSLEGEESNCHIEVRKVDSSKESPKISIMDSDESLPPAFPPMQKVLSMVVPTRPSLDVNNITQLSKFEY